MLFVTSNNRPSIAHRLFIPSMALALIAGTASLSSAQFARGGYQQGYAQPQYGNQQYQQYGQQQYSQPAQTYAGQNQQARQIVGYDQFGRPVYSQTSARTGSSTNGTLTSGHWSATLQPSDREHDFGSVAKGSRQEHIFEFENTQDCDIQLTSVRASCGCTKPEVITETVKPGETAQVLAVFDTFFKPGEKRATVTVAITKLNGYNEYGEVQFAIRGDIRQDVVLNPGKVSFDGIEPASESQRTVTVMYAGNPGWRILDVRSTNPNISVEARETRRDQAARRVDYELTVRMNGDQPIGLFSDQLTLITNDSNTTEMNVNVEGTIKAMLESSPVRLGLISLNQEVERKLVLRGAEAFEIRDVRVGNQKITFTESSEGKRSTLHVLSYTLDTSDPGMIESEITIVSDLPGQAEAVIPFSANIVQRTVTN